MEGRGEDVLIRFDGVSKAYEIHGAKSQIVRLALFGSAPTASRLALDDVSFSIRRGESIGIVGQNGGRVSAMLELGTGFNPARTGRENVMIGGLCLGLSRREILDRFDAIVDFAELADWIDEPVRTYSTGMAMRLAFAVATARIPDIVIVDEAISVGLVEMICDRALYLAGGRLVMDGPPKPVVARYLEDLFGPPETNVAALAGRETQEQRYGNGGLEIEQVALLDEHGNPANVFAPGQKARIMASLIARQEDEIVGLNVGVSVTTKEGVRLFAINPTLAKLMFPTLRRGMQATVTVDLTMNLGVGDYFITVGAWSRQSDTHYDRRVDVRHFAVRGDYALSQSLVDLQARYSVALDEAVAS